MAPRKFMGKVHEDPGEALAKGPREVMASIWEDYLAAVLQVSPNSGRFKILRRQIEAAAGFKEVYDNWNTLPLASRGAAWRRLMTAAAEDFRPWAKAASAAASAASWAALPCSPTTCRCSSRKSSPGTTSIPCGPGEQATTREGEVESLAGGAPEGPGGSRQPAVLVFLAANKSCRIYADRPEQCRRQNCWGEPPRPPAVAQLLTPPAPVRGGARRSGTDQRASGALRLRQGGPGPGRVGRRAGGGRRGPVRGPALRSLPAPDAHQRMGA